MTTALAVLLMGSAPTSVVRAQNAPDPSDVVIVLDFSASILDEKADRNRFGAALERIAARVDETSSDLVAGDTTVSIVQFAAKAADYPGCTELKLLGSHEAVAKFAHCLRSVASAYRKGLSPALTRKIGVDTNYVAAMDRAAKHLPSDAARPAMILFTDGRHDVRGVPASQVRVVRERLFGSRSPFALLPVGMGLDRTKRASLENSLAAMRIVSDMPPCVSGSTFEWPRVVFDSPGAAGNAVAVALQNATCTFTVEPPPAVPTPVVGPVRGIKVLAQDGAIALSWTAPATTANSAPVVDYRARCRSGAGEWIEAKRGVSVETKAIVDGLTNGAPYQCEVAAIGAGAPAKWTAATTTVSPLGRPEAPAKPTVEALDRALRVGVPADAPPGVASYRFECSGDGGSTWSSTIEAGTAGTPAQVDRLTNGVTYVCRAFAANAAGVSEASALSDAVTPCGNALECTGLMQPLMVLLGIVLAGGLIAASVALLRERPRGYVVAVIDVVHSANLGHGSHLGFDFVRDPSTRAVTGIVASRDPRAEIRIRRRRGGRFEVTDRRGRHVAVDGEPLVATEANGGRHQLVLRAFGTNAAAMVVARR